MTAACKNGLLIGLFAAIIGCGSEHPPIDAPMLQTNSTISAPLNRGGDFVITTSQGIGKGRIDAEGNAHIEL